MSISIQDTLQIADNFFSAGDYKNAYNSYTDAAQKGSGEAAYKLGQMYEKGIYVKRDYKAAMQWYVIAAGKGNKEAKAKFLKGLKEEGEKGITEPISEPKNISEHVSVSESTPVSEYKHVSAPVSVSIPESVSETKPDPEPISEVQSNLSPVEPPIVLPPNAPKVNNQLNGLNAPTQSSDKKIEKILVWVIWLLLVGIVGGIYVGLPKQEPKKNEPIKKEREITRPIKPQENTFFGWVLYINGEDFTVENSGGKKMVFSNSVFKKRLMIGMPVTVKTDSSEKVKDIITSSQYEKLLGTWHSKDGQIQFGTGNKCHFHVNLFKMMEPIDCWRLRNHQIELGRHRHFYPKSFDIIRLTSEFLEIEFRSGGKDTVLHFYRNKDADVDSISPRMKENIAIDVNGIKIDMVYVEGGTFMMGATDEQKSDAFEDEYPVHEVRLSSYYIGKYEVTLRHWKAVMGKLPDFPYSESWWDDKDLNKPVQFVMYDDACKFCKKLSEKTGRKFRLPTEAEWEYAARGGTKTKKYKFSGSNNIGTVAWYSGNALKDSKISRVGLKNANELGIYDMTGNLYEWCLDWYGSYSQDSQTNPQGPKSNKGNCRVKRGGSVENGKRNCHLSRRSWQGGSAGYYDGFRIALEQ